jgi:putative FmdB family regulatory protein
MPMYEMKCTSCGSEYEEYMPTHAAPLPACPTCASDKVERKMSVFGSQGLSSAGSCASTSGFS